MSADAVSADAVSADAVSADATKEARKKMLTLAIRVELHKPLGLTWDQAGDILGPMRHVAHRMINASTVENLVALKLQRPADATRAVRTEIDEIKAHAKTDGMKKLDPSSRVIDAMRQRGHDALKKYLKGKGRERIPSARRGSPIFIRDGGFSLAEKNGAVVLTMHLTAGRAGHVAFVVRAQRGHHWAVLRELCAGAHRLGSLSIVRNDRTKRWEALIAYSKPAPEPAAGDGVMVLHRGMHNFLYYLTADGRSGVMCDGSKLASQKARLAARQHEIKKGRYERGTGAIGHGKTRSFEAYSALDDKIARTLKTACQQAAARAVKRALALGCGRIVREEYGGIQPSEDEHERRFMPRFPYYQLAQDIDWAARKAGIIVELVPSEYVSTTCPRCGACDEKSHNRRRGKFHCVVCGLARQADWVAVLNMFRRTDHDQTVWNKRLKEEQQLGDAASDAASDAVSGDGGAARKAEALAKRIKRKRKD